MAIARRQRLLIALAALAAVSLALLFAWITSLERDRSSPVVVHDRATAPSSTAAPSEVAAPPAAGEQSPARTEIAKAPAAKPAVEHTAPAPARGANVTLVAKFARPDSSDVEIASGVLELRDSKGAARTIDIKQSTSVRVTGLAPSIYVARVRAPDFEHREQFLDLTKLDEATRHGSDEPVFEKTLVCWPPQWVAVIVECTDGRPLASLARDLDTEPKRLFVGAFQVHTQLDPPRMPTNGSSADAGEMQRGESALARFRPPPDYKSFEIARSCVGSLELLHAPPMWVELELFSKPVGWESLQVGAREIVFRIDRSALDERFAGVKARIVDPKDHAPVAQALVTLRADSSALRRSDQTKVPTDAAGRVVLEHIVPGRYEFQVVRGESQHQQMIDLAVGEQRDLGDIVLGEARGVDVLVMYEDGRPMMAHLELGPYRKLARSGEIYPAMMRHGAGPDGKGRLPMPSEVAIIRAAIEDGRSNGPKSSQEVHGIRSQNVVLDPSAPPSGPIKLVLRQPVNVKIVTKRPDNVRIEILDELDVVVARSVNETDKELKADVVPGRYRARTVTADGSAGLDVPFTADDKAPEISVD
jgi:hypothetical protein